jgi:hypothetical protein
MISLDLLRAGDPVEETVGPFFPDPNGNIVEVLPTTSTDDWSPSDPFEGGKFSSPEVLKSIRRQLGIAHCVLDVLVPEPGL